jgi:predicted DNA-binding transcriptional regulator AlpA
MKWHIAAALNEPVEVLWSWPPSELGEGAGATTPPPDHQEAGNSPYTERDIGIDVNEPAVLTVRQLARVLAIHPTSIYAHLKAGDFPRRPIPLPDHTRFSRREVDACSR